MHNKDKYPAIWAEMKKARETESAIFAIIDPMKKEIEEITKEIDALKAKKNAVAEKIQENYPKLTEVRNQISACARAMNGKSLSRPN